MKVNRNFEPTSAFVQHMLLSNVGVHVESWQRSSPASFLMIKPLAHALVVQYLRASKTTDPHVKPN